jgi:hypothetical protein
MHWYIGEHGQLTITSVSVFEVLFGLHAKQATPQMRCGLLVI